MQKSLIALSVVAALTAPAVFADITVNGQKISKSQVDTAISANPQLADNPEIRKRVEDSMINEEIMAQYAKKQKLDRDQTIKDRLALVERQILANAAVEKYLKENPVDDSDVQGAYDQLLQELGSDEYRARHILVKTEKEAKDIQSKLAYGEKFEDLAKAHSEDKGSGQRGGELGWFAPKMMVGPFADAVAKAEINKVVGPVKTQFGYHLIEVEEKRALTPPTFDSVKPKLLSELRQAKVQALIQEQRDKAKIKQ